MFRHQCQRKERIINCSLIGSCFRFFNFMFYNYSNFSKETQNRFWIHEFLQETHPEKYRNQCFAIYSYSYYRLVNYLIGDNWLICRLRAQCMIFNVRLCFVWLCVCHCSLQSSAWRNICLDLRLQLRTVTSTLIIADIKIN